MSVVGSYVVGEKLGQGGFAQVYVGVHQQNQTQVALKLLDYERIRSNQSMIKQVQAEISAMLRVNHENVLRIFEMVENVIFDSKPIVALALEIAPRGELFDFLAAAGAFDEVVASSYFSQIMSGIAACHQHNIVHRDIKLENLLLTGQYSVKIADFGMAGFTGPEAAVMKTRCGTVSYMCPELLQGQPYIGAAADVFALGCVLFTMLVGVPPFLKAAMNDWWYARIALNQLDAFWSAHERAFSDRTHRSLQLSAAAKDLVIRMLHPNGAERITVPDILAHPFLTSGQVLSPDALAAHMQQRWQAVLVQRAARRAQLPSQAGNADAYRGVYKSGGDDEEKTYPEPSVFTSELALKAGFFTFECKLSVGDALTAIHGFLNDYHPAASSSIDESSTRVKATVPCEGETLQVAVQLYRHAEHADLLVVDVQRTEGDRACFRDLYGRLEQELTGVAFKEESCVGNHFQMLSSDDMDELVSASE